LDTAWTVHVFRGLVLALVLLLTAPLVGWFFEDYRVVKLLQIICLAEVLNGFINVGIIYFEKELKFHKQFIYEMLSNAISLVVGIILAYKFASVWALVWANLAGVTVRCILSYVLHPYRPHYCFNLIQAKELFRFGKWMFGHTIVVFLWQEADRIIIGKMLGAAALGVYQIAYRISNLGSSQVSLATSTVAFPTYVKLREEEDRLRKAFLDVFETTICFVLPLTIFTFLAAEDIVHGLLGEKWIESIVPLKILSLAGFLGAFEHTSTPLFVAVGRPNLEFWKNFCKACIILLTIYPLTAFWGLSGTCISVVLGALVPLPIWAGVKSIAKATWREILYRMLPSLVLGLATILAIGICHLFFRHAGLQKLLFDAMAAIALYIFVAILLSRIWNKGPYVQARRAIIAVLATP